MITKKGISIGKKDIESIISYYNIGCLESYSIMPMGENINIQIKTTKGNYHIKLFIQENSEKKHFLLFELLLTDYLSNKGIKVPGIIKTSSGKLYTKHKNRFCVIYEFIDGKATYPLTRDTISQVGEFLGQFHKATMGFSCKYRTTRGRFTPRTLLHDLIHDYLPHYRNADIRAKITQESKFIYNMKYSKLPIGAIHMDIDPQNFIFKNNKLQALIDFGDALQGLLIIDVARGAYEFCLGSGLNFDFELLKIFIQHYQKYRPLTKAEKNAFSDFLRFTFIWKITDGVRAKKSNSWILKRLNMMKKVPDKFPFI